MYILMFVCKMCVQKLVNKNIDPWINVADKISIKIIDMCKACQWFE